MVGSLVSTAKGIDSKKLLQADGIKKSAPDSAIAMLRYGDLDGSLPDSIRFELHRIVGYSYLYLGSFDSALYHLTASSMLAEGATDAMNFQVENALGAVYQRFGDGKNAVSHYLNGLLFAERAKDDLGKAKVFNNLSILYRTSGDYRNAGVNARLALNIYEEAQDSFLLAGTLNNIGLVKVAMEEFDSALVYYKQALRIKEQFGDPRSVANTLNNIGIVYENKEDYQQALSYYEKAYALRKEANDQFGIASSCINIGSVYLKINDLDKTLQHIEKGQTLARQLRSADLFERLVTLKASYFEAMGRPYEAISELRNLHRMRDSLNDSDFYHDLAKAEFAAAEAEARSDIEQIKLENKNEKEQLRLQRFVNLLMALVISVFVGMLALLLYQLAQLKKLRERLVVERDSANLVAYERRETLQQAAHEIKTPTNSIVALAHLIEQETDSAEKEKMNAFLLESCDNLMNTVSNLLSISRIEQGKVVVTPVSTSLTNWLNKEMNFLRPLAEHKGLELRLEVPDTGNFTIETDTDLLQQVLRNVAGNAIKFTMEGFVLVKVEEAGDQVVIHISDTGPGIARPDHRYIFDSFYKASKVDMQGSGLGLSIAAKCTESLGGKIDFRSEVGKGSEFSIYLPKKLS